MLIVGRYRRIEDGGAHDRTLCPPQLISSFFLGGRVQHAVLVLVRVRTIPKPFHFRYNSAKVEAFLTQIN